MESDFLWESTRFERLIQDAQAGSADSLGQLLEQFRDYLLLVANRELGRDLHRKVGASDLVQQTFVEAHEHIGDFQGSVEVEMVGWLRQILLHQILGMRRRYSHTQMRNIARECAPSDDSSVERRIESLPSDDCPYHHVSTNESVAAIYQALDSLPVDYRQVIEWRYWEKLTFSEIGERLGRSAEAARKLWLRAVKQLARDEGCQRVAP